MHIYRRKSPRAQFKPTKAKTFRNPPPQQASLCLLCIMQAWSETCSQAEQDMCRHRIKIKPVRIYWLPKGSIIHTSGGGGGACRMLGCSPSCAGCWVYNAGFGYCLFVCFSPGCEGKRRECTRGALGTAAAWRWDAVLRAGAVSLLVPRCGPGLQLWASCRVMLSLLRGWAGDARDLHPSIITPIAAVKLRSGPIRAAPVRREAPGRAPPRAAELRRWSVRGGAGGAQDVLQGEPGAGTEGRMCFTLFAFLYL